MSTQSSLISATIKEMEQGKSILLSFGAPGRLLKRKMVLTGFVCRFLCFYIFNPIFLLRARFSPDIWRRRKATAIRVAQLLFPYQVKGYQITPSSCGQIFVMNHPTLNDPLCVSLYALSLYPDREIIIPVNLPWFEAVCHYRSKLLNIGVHIVPILTPETAKRLGSDNLISEMQRAFITNYTSELIATLSRGGLVVVAQHATRRRHLFRDPAQSESGDGILGTISLILSAIRRAKLPDQTCFIPVGVMPHILHAKPGLNLFRKYTLNVGKPILATDLADAKNSAKYSADLHILLRLAELLPTEYHFAN